MPPLTQDDIEAKVKEYEVRTGIYLDVNNKSTLRDMIRKEHRFEERREAYEEQGHSNSAVGDRNGMTTYNQD